MPLKPSEAPPSSNPRESIYSTYGWFPLPASSTRGFCTSPTTTTAAATSTTFTATSAAAAIAGTTLIPPRVPPQPLSQPQLLQTSPGWCLTMLIGTSNIFKPCLFLTSDLSHLQTLSFSNFLHLLLAELETTVGFPIAFPAPLCFSLSTRGPPGWGWKQTTVPMNPGARWQHRSDRPWPHCRWLWGFFASSTPNWKCVCFVKCLWLLVLVRLHVCDCWLDYCILHGAFVWLLVVLSWLVSLYFISKSSGFNNHSQIIKSGCFRVGLKF